MTLLFDAVELSQPRLTKDGFLVGEAFVARTGIQLYYAGELGLADVEPDKIIRVYRPPEEVFNKDSMSTYAHRTITLGHPREMVDAENWKTVTSGQTGDEVMRDGDRVRVPLTLMDAGAIRAWKEGVREFSMGYVTDLDVTSGETPDGETYDAVQRNLRMNHLALVSRARGGSNLRLGDVQPEENSMDVKLTTVSVDGLSVQTTDAGAQAISKLMKELADERTDRKSDQEAHAAALVAKDQELAKKDAKIDELTGKVLDEAALDARVKERADLIAKAKKVADKDYTGMSAEEIRKAAVTAVKGSAAVADKSPAYIEARFDTLVEDAEQDPVRRVVRNGSQPANDEASRAHAEMVTNMQNAWKGEEAK